MFSKFPDLKRVSKQNEFVISCYKKSYNKRMIKKGFFMKSHLLNANFLICFKRNE